MGREARRVPTGWTQPLSSEGEKINIAAGNYADDYREWMYEWTAWQRGEVRNYEDGGPEFVHIDDKYRGMCYTQYAGSPPNPDRYIPEIAEGDPGKLVMFSTTSDTAMSPGFDTPEELARWLVDNNASVFGYDKATYEEWLQLCREADGGDDA